MTVLGESVSFSVSNNSAIPSAALIEDCSYIHVIDALAEIAFVQDKSLDDDFAGIDDKEEEEEPEKEKLMGFLKLEAKKTSNNKLELKELPSHLKYIFLEEDE